MLYIGIHNKYRSATGGICIDNIIELPTLEWYFVDAGGPYAPDFQDQPNSGTTNPDAPPVCFDIVDPCWADGDVDNDGATLSVNDYIKLMKYVQDCSYTPPLLYKCDLYGDGVIDQLDVDIYEAYFQQGMGAFICGYPARTRCDCCSYPSVISTNPAMNANGVSKTADVDVTFDFDIKPPSLENTNMFRVIGTKSGWKTSGIFSYNSTIPPMYTETFDPANDFLGGEMVVVNIAQGVESVCGVVSPCYYQYQFTVANKKGNGSFTQGFMNNAGGNVSSTVAADFNGDGYLDLATVFADSDSMSSLLNNGSGQLSLSRGVYPVGYKGTSTNKPAGIVASDYDMDDDIDVVITRGGDDIDSSAFVFMENDGLGGFTSTGLQPLIYDGLSHSTPSIITGDYNGDGYSDLVMAIGDYDVDSAALLYFENNGEGAFSPVTRGVYPVGYKGTSTNKPAGLVAGDWDSDGTLDVGMFLDNYDVDSAALLIFNIEGDGTVNERDVLPLGYIGPSNGTPACISADFDGDGHLGIVVTMNSSYADSSTMCFYNWGDTLFHLADAYTLGYNSTFSGMPASVIADGDAVGDSCDNCIDVYNPDQADSNGNDIGNACDYICGDADASGAIDIDDVVYLINYIFASGPAPDPLASGDANCSGDIDIDDVVYLINYIFAGGYAPCDTDGDGIPDC